MLKNSNPSMLLKKIRRKRNCVKKVNLAKPGYQNAVAITMKNDLDTLLKVSQKASQNKVSSQIYENVISCVAAPPPPPPPRRSSPLYVGYCS